MQRKTNPLRRAVALGAAAGFVAALVAGCGGGGDAAQTELGKNDTLTITTFGDFGYSDAIAEWNADPASPFKVKETKIAQWDTWKQTLTSNMQAGTGLTDVVAIEGDAMPQFLTAGASEQFADLTDHSLDNRWVDYKYVAGQTPDGKQIGYPTDAGPEAICYRADLFRQAGLPTDRAAVAKMFESWDSYFAAGQQFVKKVPATKWYDSSGSIAQAMLNQVKFPFQTSENMVDVENADLKHVFDTVSEYSPALSTRAVQWSDDWTANFTNNGFATMPCPGWMFAYIKESAPSVQGWDIANVFPGGGGNWGGSFLAVPVQSQHQKEAKEFANWITDTQQQISAFDSAGAYPANLAAEQELSKINTPDPYFANAPTAQILADRAQAVPAGVPYKGDKYSDILGLFQTAIQRVDEGQSPEASWQTFTQAVQKMD
ncbi:ABC transporter substrate-binding protein [Gordonia rhizosphera]|uniref:Cellobiose ABC transporter substrate-binding protein n=1 Tax=Gordonia rhizosphera NBRC 16068 TaxID=1108045 RepID=K6V509_9ACTN|nr:ABC transporter substrate-binding protein [Gordonia rhizosphera]GAB91273.1 cellobiose ABC transporter substrate-binding protein [Gordonia rhizosphera NBRC 16068]